MTYTHCRISRKATCTRVTLSNIPAIIDLLNKDKNIVASQYRDGITVRLVEKRKGQLDIQHIKHGWWVIEQEDKAIKVMNQAEFTSKYQAIP